MHTTLESKKKSDLANKVCALLAKDGDAGRYTPIQPRRSPRRVSPSSVGSMASGHLGPGSITGSSGRNSASKAPSGAFGDDHAMERVRTRIASRNEKKKQVAEGATKSQSSRGRASKETKKATTDDEGRKLIRLIDRALHDISGETGEMDDANDADCTALGPLALKMAKVYTPCALVVKTTELMEGVGDTHGNDVMRPMRKEDIVDWLIRVLYTLEYYDRGFLTYAGVVTLLEKRE